MPQDLKKIPKLHGSQLMSLARLSLSISLKHFLIFLVFCSYNITKRLSNEYSSFSTHFLEKNLLINKVNLFPLDNEWKKLTHMFYTEKGNKQKDIKNYLSKIELKISVITAPLLLENASKN